MSAYTDSIRDLGMALMRQSASPYVITCRSCNTSMRYDALRFMCDSCCCEVCPACAGMGPRDCDDPMPKVECCPACVEDELREAGGGIPITEVSNGEAFERAADRNVIAYDERTDSYHHNDAYYAGGAWHMAGGR